MRAGWSSEPESVRASSLAQPCVDALDVSFEFGQRRSLVCADIIRRGTHEMPPGSFSNDAPFLPSIRESIRECGGANIEDMRSRLRT